MKAYKPLRKRKDGTLGPLFIDRRLRVPVGAWLQAENHPTKGYAVRPGFHCCQSPDAPHLSMEDRVWYLVEIADYREHRRPASQGGTWLIAQKMRALRLLNFCADDRII